MKEFKAFIIGSSIISTIISLTYIGNAFRNSGRPSDIPYEILPIFIAIMFGIFNMINVYFDFRGMETFILGGIMGVIFSIIGRFGYNLPTRIFGFSDNEYLVHFIAFVLYGTIFRFIVQPLNERFIHFEEICKEC